MNETVTGSFDGTTLDFHSTYQGGYQWSHDSPLDGSGTFTGNGVTSVTWAISYANATDYKNHGAYVSATGGGKDAAHSYIGMPIKP